MLSHVYVALMTASTTARARARTELTKEIKATARGHLVEVGAAALSLRAVARDLGMASSAVYRYFPSRDDLLTALIVDAYDAVGAVAEEAERTGRRGFVERWVLLASAVRSWAVASPQEYALVYGSPVPGYRAPVDTVEPAVRVVAVALRMVSEGLAAGEIDPAPRLPLPRGVKRDLRNVRALAPDVPEEVLARALEAWASLLGSLSLELFGHIENVVFDREAFFLHQARRAATVLASA